MVATVSEQQFVNVDENGVVARDYRMIPVTVLILPFMKTSIQAHPSAYIV